jgi:hypothetical protein
VRIRAQVSGVAAAVCVLFAGCTDDNGPAATATPSPTASVAASPSAVACLPFAGPPDGSAKRPYLKRAMALECREDVKQLQEALRLNPDGFFDFDTAAAVIARQQPYDCITADDGQVGPQTWALIVDGTEPCEAGAPSAGPRTAPAWARCGSAAADWALRGEDGTVLRRCGQQLVLVYDGTTHAGAVRELGSSVCAEFDEAFSAPSGTRTSICVSNPATDEAMQADPTSGDGSAGWREDVAARYVRPA